MIGAKNPPCLSHEVEILDTFVQQADGTRAVTRRQDTYPAVIEAEVKPSANDPGMIMIAEVTRGGLREFRR